MTKKNIQVIDGSYNSCYSIYSIEDKYFNLIFPHQEQDIEFASDFVSRAGKRLGNRILKELWKNEVDRKSINGIHGTLFSDYEDCDCGKDIAKKKKYYLSKN
jgi:hypothetical protein